MPGSYFVTWIQHVSLKERARTLPVIVISPGQHTVAVALAALPRVLLRNPGLPVGN